QQLRKGVELKDGMTRPAKARKISDPGFPERNPPVRKRQSIPTSWVELVISEGRNRQVRRMSAAVGFPTLRLVRTRIGNWTLDGLNSGENRELEVNLPVAPKAAVKRKPKTAPRKNNAKGSQTGKSDNRPNLSGKERPGQNKRSRKPRR
ncbi:MAG: pseudouridine synthase, partial [Oceanospirillum sp.]|nr:pseudouridine synthase [Oceanospirillum sp.]